MSRETVMMSLKNRALKEENWALKRHLDFWRASAMLLGVGFFCMAALVLYFVF